MRNFQGFLVAVVLASFGCDDGAVGSGPGDSGGERDAQTEAGTGRDEAGVRDFGTLDALVPDAWRPLPPGAICVAASDCESDYCVPGPDGRRVCTPRCRDDSDCPDKWECRPVANSGPDATFICVAERQVLCLPCEHDGDCGAGRDLCLTIGHGNYCGRNCDLEECPEGFSCQDVLDDAGAVRARQCLPDDGTCRPCRDGDGDGYGIGDECPGIDCDDTDPEVYEGAVEVCDNKDNDCNSLPDDEVAVPEDVGCLPDGVCAGTAPACRVGEWVCLYPDSYQAGAERSCDTLDNDCDGVVDEDFDLTADPGHCGQCGHVCGYPNATGQCAESVCRLGPCNDGFWNVDGAPANGCEYACQRTRDGVEACDGIDNDCDGLIDEDFDLHADGDHCGRCGVQCARPNAAGLCDNGQCVVGPCDAGFVDLDGVNQNGCEYACAPSGEEVCDRRDNDCDGDVDEGFDVQADPSHCGQCDHACAFDNAVPLCVAGQCRLGPCEAPWWNADRDPDNGCEYRCEVSNGGAEICDTRDNDCNGVVDDGYDLLGDVAHCGGCNRVCAYEHAQTGCFEGQCLLVGCVAGWVNLDRDPANGCELECTPDPNPAEICDARDNDCNGRIDEGFDLDNDEQNCGACGEICAPENGTGQCRLGDCVLTECDEGSWDLDGDVDNGCEYECALSAGGIEACDDRDNDCDGAIDEDFDLSNDPGNCGECDRGCGFDHSAPACANGACVLGPCENGFHDLDDLPANGCEYGPCVPTAGGQEVCDFIDNDCNGAVDEGYDFDSDEANCGVCGRVCALPHATPICVDGGCRIDRCAEGYVDLDDDPANGCEYPCRPTGDEVCDQRDNDCDGQIDEGFDLEGSLDHCGGCNRRCELPNSVTACGGGRCRFVECAAGYWNVNNTTEDGCEYGLCPLTNGGVERCDDIDNDCDGQIDEALTRECGSDVGQCRIGGQTCAAGEWGVCANEVGPEREICDGRDNDCDGAVDEELTRVCGNNVGDCRTGLETCVEGDWGACEGDIGPQPESCDNRDNNCNGQVDEDVSRSCGLDVGECRTGTEVCLQGQWGVCQDVGEPQDETCDNRDNDCDGAVDEDLFRPCGIDTGECVSGVETCAAGRWGFCDGEVVPALEICDGRDNDCDGQTDEDLARPCGTDDGECRLGQQICGNGQWGACQGNVDPVDEICDNRDNDCDGAVDEDLVQGCGSDVGACQRGAQTCAAGHWGVCAGEIRPAVEICDNRDNDCDGQTDEDLIRACGTDVGECERGQQTCRIGAWGECLGDVEPVAEVCDGRDNNCNGDVDEGFDQRVDDPDEGYVDANCDGIDGDRDRAVFVRPDGLDGRDGLTPANAVATLSRAVAVARATGRDQILLADGVYRSAVGLVLNLGLGIHGGYSADFRTRQDIRATLVFTAAGGVIVVSLNQPLLLDQLDIEVTDRQPGSSESAIALLVAASGDNPTLHRVDVQAGRGGSGTAGGIGGAGAQGNIGVGGSGENGGGGGSIGGGAGATGLRRAAGPAGTNGNVVAANCGNGGAGSGSAGLGCNDGDPHSGGNGQNGCAGAAGTHGQAGSNLGSINGLLWSAVHATGGDVGVNGGGGGGGGAGGGENCRDPIFGNCIFCGTGRGGGGAGGGGRGGNGGGGGRSGAASIGVLLSASTIHVNQVAVSTVGGGDGGDGGNDGAGGPGGSGGSGAPATENTHGAGGDGGDGARGGSGGCGGGGGGGPSIAIWGGGGSAVVRNGLLRLLPGGGGGGGASCGTAGARGVSAETRDVQLQ